MSVTHIGSTDEYRRAIASAGSKVVVIDFFAKWCGPCKAIAPRVEQLAAQYADTALFLKVDTDEQPEIAAAERIRSMPTFVFYQNGRRVLQFSGADAARLEGEVQRLGASVQEAEGAPPVPEGLPAGVRQLLGDLQKEQCECLNQSDDNTIANLFENDDSLVESDCDEQLLLHLTFRNPVRIHSLRVRAPTDGRAPASLKLFVNQPTIDFDGAEGSEPAFEVPLTADNVDGETLLPLKYVRFQKVSVLSVFVADNQDDDGEHDTSAMHYLEFFGSSLQGTNMQNFKRVAGEAGEAE